MPVERVMNLFLAQAAVLCEASWWDGGVPAAGINIKKKKQ
jgi:hypothetical protein